MSAALALLARAAPQSPQTGAPPAPAQGAAGDFAAQLALELGPPYEVPTCTEERPSVREQAGAILEDGDEARVLAALEHADALPADEPAIDSGQPAPSAAPLWLVALAGPNATQTAPSAASTADAVAAAQSQEIAAPSLASASPEPAPAAELSAQTAARTAVGTREAAAKSEPFLGPHERSAARPDPSAPQDRGEAVPAPDTQSDRALARPERSAPPLQCVEASPQSAAPVPKADSPVPKAESRAPQGEPPASAAASRLPLAVPALDARDLPRPQTDPQAARSLRAAREIAAGSAPQRSPAAAAEQQPRAAVTRAPADAAPPLEAAAPTLDKLGAPRAARSAAERAAPKSSDLASRIGPAAEAAAASAPAEPAPSAPAAPAAAAPERPTHARVSATDAGPTAGATSPSNAPETAPSVSEQRAAHEVGAAAQHGASDTMQAPDVPTDTTDAARSAPTLLRVATPAPAHGSAQAHASLPTPAEAVPLHVEWLASRGGGSARLVLDPPHLGPLDVSVKVRGQQVEIVFLTHEAATPALVHAQRGSLEAALAALDLRLDHFEVRGATRPDSAGLGLDAGGLHSGGPQAGGAGSDPGARQGQAPDFERDWLGRVQRAASLSGVEEPSSRRTLSGAVDLRV